MFNAIFWLNKTLQTLFYDINQSIIYINIAIEYSVSQEPPQNYYDDYPELEDLVNEFRKIIDSKIINKKLNSQVKNIVAKIQYDNSVNAKFFNMMERMKINLTEKQEQNYRNIRKARNSIIHNNEEIDIVDHIPYNTSVDRLKIISFDNIGDLTFNSNDIFEGKEFMQYDFETVIG